MEDLTRRVNTLETDMATVKAHNQHMNGTLTEIKDSMNKAQEKVESVTRTSYKIAGGLAVVAAVAPFIAKFMLG